MAYKIRYGPDEAAGRRISTGRRCRAGAAAVLTVLTLFLRLSWNEGRAFLSALVTGGPGTLTERAVFQMSQALATGEGWYHALEIWCAAILRGA